MLNLDESECTHTPGLGLRTPAMTATPRCCQTDFLRSTEQRDRCRTAASVYCHLGTQAHGPVCAPVLYPHPFVPRKGTDCQRRAQIIGYHKRAIPRSTLQRQIGNPEC